MLTFGSGFYASLVATWWFGRTIGRGEPEDEIAGSDSNLGAWKL